MKKRILALALAGTTAFSVFGGLNVFAAVADYEEYTPVKIAFKSDSDGEITYTSGLTGGATATPHTYVDSSITDSGSDTSAAKYKAQFDRYKKLYTIASAMDFSDTTETVKKADVIYMYDYAVNKDQNNEALALDVEEFISAYDAARAVLNADGDDWEGTHTQDALKKLLSDLDEAENAVWTEVIKVYGTASSGNSAETGYDANKTSARKSVYVDFVALQDEVSDLKASDYENKYNFSGLLDDIKEANAATTTSNLVYLMQEYDRLMGEIDLVDPSKAEDDYYTALDKANAREESDYTAANWNRVQAYILEAEEKAAEANTKAEWEAAKAILDKISSIQTIKPDYADLKDALLDLYVSGKTSALESGRYDANYTSNEDVYVYIASDYKVKTSVYTDEWYDFAGYLDDATHEDYIEGAYRAAYSVYKRCASASQIKYVGQSEVDKALSDLEAAIDALDTTSSAVNWKFVRLEETIATAEDVVESDYTVTKSAWKNFVSALEEAQEVISMSKPSSRQLDNAWKELDAALKALENAQKVVPYATKTELKDLLKEAKELIKETEDKTGAQVSNLKTAIDDGQEVYDDVTNALISEVEGAIADLEAAIAGYNHPQGWYQDDKGTWFYGEGTTNKTGWLELNGRTYFLKDDGSMAANTWVKTEAGYWYYLNASGAMMHDGWAKINDTWYFFKNFGGMAEGWVKDGNTWYYLTPGSGAMVSNGWSLINGKYYYFTESGAMLANTTTPDGYKVDASGAWVK